MSFSAHTVGLSSGPVHYQRGGSGPPLLHLHSSGGPRVSPVIERIAQRHTVFMPVAPGFNATPEHATVKTIGALADLMGEFARTVIGGKFDAMGESFGGWVALWVAARNPELVEHLVLEAPAGLREQGTGGVPADPAGRMRALYSKPEHAAPETRSPQVIADTQRVRDGYVGGIDYDKALHDALPGIRARTLIVLGTRDTVVPVITAHRLKAGIPNAHLSFIYGAAHALEFDAPARVAPLVAGFLERGEAFVVRSSA
jgi:pimeloyl-ACP methyl ester carboxylesterase